MRKLADSELDWNVTQELEIHLSLVPAHRRRTLEQCCLYLIFNINLLYYTYILKLR
jgi:hypothetical protein